MGAGRGAAGVRHDRSRQGRRRLQPGQRRPAGAGPCGARAVHAVGRDRDARPQRHPRSPGTRAVVIGRSEIVGKPMAMLLLQRDATVTICSLEDAGSGRRSARRPTSWSSAIGRPGFVTPEFVKPGATVIDVGIYPAHATKAIAQQLFARGLAAAGRLRAARLAGRRRRPPGRGRDGRRPDAGARRRRSADHRDAAQEHRDRRARGTGADRSHARPVARLDTGTLGHDRMLRAALTGGIATGKSFCLARFAALGARGHRRRRRSPATRSRPAPPASPQVVARFGTRRPAARRRARSRGARADRVRATAPPAPTSKRSSIPRSTAASRMVRQPAVRHPRRHRRHPAAVRDRPCSHDFDRDHRLRLRRRRSSSGGCMARDRLTEPEDARARLARSGRSPRRCGAPTT